MPDPRNARTHSKRQVDQIVASIREFGFTNPILRDADGVVIAGHGRLLAAKAMKYPPAADLPVMTRSYREPLGSEWECAGAARTPRAGFPGRIESALRPPFDSSVARFDYSISSSNFG